MKSQNFDVLEVILKNDLRLPLEKKEEEWLKQIDDETKESFIDLLNSPSFLEEIKDLSENIIAKSLKFTEEEQEIIRKKCEERIKQLEGRDKKAKTFQIKK